MSAFSVAIGGRTALRGIQFFLGQSLLIKLSNHAPWVVTTANCNLRYPAAYEMTWRDQLSGKSRLRISAIAFQTRASSSGLLQPIFSIASRDPEHPPVDVELSLVAEA